MKWLDEKEEHEVIKAIEEGFHFNSFEGEYARIIRLINLAEFKRRQAAPGVKVSKVAFGTGRRLPIVAK